MGKGQSRPGDLHDCARLAASKFTDDEMQVLQRTYQDLADRSYGKGIDKDTFLQYVPLSGLLGDRLYSLFDGNKKGLITFDEFVMGLARFSRGTTDDKIRFLFDLYDVSDDDTVSKAEFATLLNQIPYQYFDNTRGIGRRRTSSQIVRQPSVGLMSAEDSGEEDLASAGESPKVSRAPTITKLPDELSVGDFADEVDAYTNHDIIERVFEECDLTGEGRLHYEEFKMFVKRNPGIIMFFEDLLPYCGSKEETESVKGDKSRVLPRSHTRRKMSTGASVLPSPRYGVKRGISSPAPVPMDEVVMGGVPLVRRSSNASPSPMQGSFSFDNTSAKEDMIISAPRNPQGGASTLKPEMGLGNGELSNSFLFDLSSTSLSAGAGVASGCVSMDSMDTEARTYMLLTAAMETTQNEDLKRVIREVIDHIPNINNIADVHNNGFGVRGEDVEEEEKQMEGFLWKKGKFLHLWSKRYYILNGNSMYYYDTNIKEDMALKGVVFLSGCLVEVLEHDEDNEVKGYFGFEIIHQDFSGVEKAEHHRHEKRVFYCKSEKEREGWVSALQHAAQVVPIEDDYVIGKELGKGRFSVVKECVNVHTNKHCAVKVIDKRTIETEDKGLLRTEIAVLKLVDHPNIIKLEGIYECKNYIYIVMEKLTGGELFERIVGRPRFSELEAARLIKPLLEAVAYLHDLGIAHRDLKPENILCGEQLEDIKIADFGLSKMVLPKEKMQGACGTLSYVAPEVLTMQGYGVQADVWSVGVILFLILLGKLPFDGDDHNEIIRKTIQAEPAVNPTVWNKLSEDGRNIISAMLNKNPNSRITARECLRHPFLTVNCSHSVINSGSSSPSPLAKQHK